MDSFWFSGCIINIDWHKPKKQQITAQHSTAQHSTAQRNPTQHGTARHGTAQYSTAQRNTAQQSTAQHSATTTQHNNNTTTTQHNNNNNPQLCIVHGNKLVNWSLLEINDLAINDVEVEISNFRFQVKTWHFFSH